MIKAAACDDMFGLRLICAVSLLSLVAYTIEKDVISAFFPHTASLSYMKQLDLSSK